MPLNTRSEAVDQLAETLASRAGASKTEAVRIALANESEQREGERDASMERVRRIQDASAASPESGLEADEAFYDSLYDA